MKRAMHSILFCCVFFLTLGAATALAQNPPPPPPPGPGVETEGCEVQLQLADNELTAYIQSVSNNPGLFWFIPPTSHHKHFYVTGQGSSCNESTGPALTELKQQVHNWVDSLRDQKLALVPTPTIIYIRGNWSESGDATLTLDLRIDTQESSQANPPGPPSL